MNAKNFVKSVEVLNKIKSYLSFEHVYPIKTMMGLLVVTLLSQFFVEDYAEMKLMLVLLWSALSIMALFVVSAFIFNLVYKSYFPKNVAEGLLNEISKDFSLDERLAAYSFFYELNPTSELTMDFLSKNTEIIKGMDENIIRQNELVFLRSIMEKEGTLKTNISISSSPKPLLS